MNRYSSIFVLLVFVFCNTGISQIIIDNSDMPEAGDTIRTSSAIDLGMIDFEQTGAGFTWDFSALYPISQSVDTFVTVQQTPWIYQLIFLTSANQAKKLREYDQFPGFQVTDGYEYYKNNNSDYRFVGVGVTLNGIPLPNKFDSPDIIYQFPVAYEDEDSSMSSYEFDIPGIGYSGGWKKRINYADGWGTLITPYGSFETLRIRSDIIQFDSIYIDSLGFGIPVYRNYIEFKWLGKDHGLPLCTVHDDGLLPTFTYIDSVRTLFVGQELPLTEHFEVNVHPNPVKENLILEIKNPPSDLANISIHALDGAVVKNENFHLMTGKMKRLDLDISRTGLRRGLYVIRINFKHSGGCIRKIVKL
ncbi:MAG: T9SS type A sorting domain-containing protein [Bacteroidales bacterium]|nr:T9SS type A sorting domain-containing protein [Bacteroidales bacterium]